MNAIEKIDQEFERLESAYPGALVHASMARKEFRAALAEAWEMGNDAGYGYGYEVGNGYEFPESTDNPFEEKA